MKDNKKEILGDAAVITIIMIIIVMVLCARSYLLSNYSCKELKKTTTVNGRIEGKNLVYKYSFLGIKLISEYEVPVSVDGRTVLFHTSIIAGEALAPGAMIKVSRTIFVTKANDCVSIDGPYYNMVPLPSWKKWYEH